MEDTRESIEELSMIFSTANFACDVEDSSNATPDADGIDLDIGIYTSSWIVFWFGSHYKVISKTIPSSFNECLGSADIGKRKFEKKTYDRRFQKWKIDSRTSIWLPKWFNIYFLLMTLLYIYLCGLFVFLVSFWCVKMILTLMILERNPKIRTSLQHLISRN